MIPSMQPARGYHVEVPRTHFQKLILLQRYQIMEFIQTGRSEIDINDALKYYRMYQSGSGINGHLNL